MSVGDENYIDFPALLFKQGLQVVSNGKNVLCL
jgi:hypothetical protein